MDSLANQFELLRQPQLDTLSVEIALPSEGDVEERRPLYCNDSVFPWELKMIPSEDENTSATPTIEFEIDKIPPSESKIYIQYFADVSSEPAESYECQPAPGETPGQIVESGE